MIGASKSAVLDAVTSAALILAAVVVIWPRIFRAPGSNRPAMALPAMPVDLGGRQLLGSIGAETVLIEFADAECPFCLAFARDTMPSISARYVETGTLAIAFVHLPLAIHPYALRAAQAAECANDQGLFWAFQALAFRLSPGQLGEASLSDSAAQLSLDRPVFESCMKASASPRIAEDKRLSDGLGIRSTPTFLVGNRLSGNRVKVSHVIDGAKPTNEFLQVLDAATKRR